MHERQSRADEQVFHELIGFAGLIFGDRFDQLNAQSGLERVRVTQQKIHMLAKKFVEKMDIFIWAHDVKDVIQRHFRTDQITRSHHGLQHSQESQLGRGQKGLTQAIG